MLRDRVAGAFNGEFNGKTVEYQIFAGHDARDDPKYLSHDKMWKTQPNLRTVVDFYARNIAQLGLHTFERNGEDSERVRGTDLTRLLGRPNPTMTGPEFIYALVADIALYDEGFVWVRRNVARAEGYDLYVIPAPWVTRNGGDALSGPKSYSLSLDDGKPTEVPADQVIEFKGWTPSDPSKGTSPVETLRMILEERRAAEKYRNQLWKKAGRIGGMFTRPVDAPNWSNDARKRFMNMVRDFTGKGARAGQDMLIEDGMKYERVALVAKEEQFVEAAKLSLETVAQVYQINPTMIGLLDNANFSNVREFRRGLYGDTLGPVIVKIEARLNEFLLPMIGADDDTYVEFNVEAKLRGSFEEQAKVLSSAVGGPWQTRNEARKMFNYPAIEGGDELIVPKNVSEGGQASPVDGGSASTQYEGTPEDGADTSEEPQDGTLGGLESIVVKFLDHQRASVSSRLGAGRDDWWDDSRWSKSLAGHLEDFGMTHEEALFKSDQINARVREHYETHGVCPVDIESIEELLA